MKKLSLILILALLAGCAGTSSLQRTLEDRKGSLMYVHDSEKIADKKSGSLKLSSFTVEDVLAPDTVVTRKSSFFLPLIFFNMWKQEDQARLGYSQLENDYKQFFKESFIEEMKRSGLYAIRDGQGDLALEVKIKKIEMSAPINQDGNFIFAVFFFAFGSHTTAGPVDVSVDADVKASKGGAVVLAKEVKGSFRTNILAGKNANLKDYTTAMIEGVSMAVKNLNEKIVKEINKI
jgi:hypothetical protein